MATVPFHVWHSEYVEKEKSKYKNLYRRKGENAVYEDLKKRYPKRRIMSSSKVVTLKEYVNDIKLELEQEKKIKNK